MSAVVDAVDCEDTTLVDDAMPCHLDCQMSQDSIRLFNQTHAIVHSTPCNRSGSDVAPIKCATFKQKLLSRPKAEGPRSGSTRA